MKTKIMKAAASVIAVMLTFGTIPTAASATSNTSVSDNTESTEVAMKAALTKVKKRITIPAELSEFQYSKDTNYGTTAYTFTWSAPSNQSYNNITVTISGDVIYSYESTNYSEYTMHLAKLSDDQLVAKAKAQLKKLNPSISDKCKFELDTINLFGNTAAISFKRYENGIEVATNCGTVTLDKDTGALISCSVQDWWQKADFSAASKAISTEKAKAAYAKLCTLTPKYAISTEYANSKYVTAARLVYRPDFSGEIDALTGKASTIWDDMNKDSGVHTLSFGNNYYLMEDDAVDEEMSAEANAVTFTPAELKEISADESLLSKDKLTEIFNKDSFIKLPTSYKLENSSLSKTDGINGDDGEYFYNMDYYEEGKDEVRTGSFDVFVNAQTGKVNRFTRWTDAELDDSKPYPVSNCVKIANSAIKHFYPTIYSYFKANEENNAESGSYAYKNSDGKDAVTYETSRRFAYTRFANNVEVEGDFINTEVDRNGSVNSIDYNFTTVPSFPSVPKFNSAQAFKKLFEQQDMNCYFDGYYKKDGSVKVYLIYKTDAFTLDRSYKLCDYDGGELYSYSAENTNYTDIGGIKQENAIKSLARYGITLSSENGKFNPNGTISSKEFSDLISSVARGGYYQVAESTDKDEKEITNAKAAEIFVSNKFGDEIASWQGIYNPPYSDVSADSKYAGSISIAYVNGFMKGTKGGKFNPSHKLTRAEAMQIVYNYVKLASEENK